MQSDAEVFGFTQKKRRGAAYDPYGSGDQSQDVTTNAMPAPQAYDEPEVQAEPPVKQPQPYNEGEYTADETRTVQPPQMTTQVEPDKVQTDIVPTPTTNTPAPSNVEGGGNATWGASSNAGPIAGWDGGKWGDRDQQALKYRFGRAIAESGMAATPENAAKVIDDAIANGVNIERDPRDPSAFLWTNPNGYQESIRLVSGNNTWMYNGFGSGSVSNPEQAYLPENAGDLTAAQLQQLIAMGPTTQPPTTTYTPPSLPPIVTPPNPDVQPPTVWDPIGPSETAVGDPPPEWVSVQQPPDVQPLLPPDVQPPGPDLQPPAQPPVVGDPPQLPNNQPAQISPEDQAVRDALLKALGGPSAQEVAANASNSPAVAAYRRASDREYGRARAQAAESAAQSGTIGSGGFAGNLRQLEEGRAERNLSFEGEQARQAMLDRQNELEKAMALATQRGQFTEAQKLQKEIANMQAALTTRGQDIQNTQFSQSLLQNAKQFSQSLGYNYAQLDQNQKQFAAQLQTNKEQFLKSLGFNYDQLNAQQKQFLANLDQNRDQFVQSLGLSYAQLTAQQQQAMAALAQNNEQFKASLGQQNYQFQNTLGFNFAQLQQQADRDAALAILNGYGD